MKNYTYGWKLKYDGWQEITVENETNRKKADYVTNKLAPAVVATREWDGCSYVLMRNGECVREFVKLSANGGGSRFIDVTGDSIAAIFSETAENIF